MRVAVGITGVEDSQHRSMLRMQQLMAMKLCILPCLYCFQRSDVKTGFAYFLLSEALNLMTSVLAAWTLGASVIPEGVTRNLSLGMLV